jgi:hypothetical protein
MNKKHFPFSNKSSIAKRKRSSPQALFESEELFERVRKASSRKKGEKMVENIQKRMSVVYVWTETKTFVRNAFRDTQT